MVKSIHELNKNDVVKIGDMLFTVLDRLDLYKSSMDTENNLQKIEVRLSQKENPEKEALIINIREGFFLLNRIEIKKSLLKKLRFRFKGEQYELKERIEVVRSEKDVKFFHNARVYRSRLGMIISEKIQNDIATYQGEEISGGDIFIVEKSGGAFIPKRNYFKFGEIEKRKINPLLAAVLSVVFLFFGLLYISPWAAMAGFVLMMVPPIIWGVEAFFAAPLICLLISQIAADMKNRKFYRF